MAVSWRLPRPGSSISRDRGGRENPGSGTLQNARSRIRTQKRFAGPQNCITSHAVPRVCRASNNVVPVRDVTIRDESIRLGQFLKLAGMVDTGSEAKLLLEDEQVRVNDVIETRRGRRLRSGDRVAVAGDIAKVVAVESMAL